MNHLLKIKQKRKRKDKTAPSPEDKSTEQKKIALIKELFEDTSLASDAEPFSPKSTTSSESDSKAAQHQKVDKELTSYSYDKDDIQCDGTDEINEKANKNKY